MNIDELVIKKIVKSNTIIEYEYEFDGKWKELINMKEKMFAKYDVDISDVPDSIAIIPFLSNILPICWIFNLTISVSELDKNFYESLEEMKNGYKKMYPNQNFRGNVLVKNIVSNSYEGKNSCVMFSGGVDAFNTLITHINEKPDIVTIYGADIELTDQKGIYNVNKHHQDTADKLKLNYHAIYSNCRTSINYNNLNNYVEEKLNCEWWHDFQHGLALIGLTVPLSYVEKYSKVYIASSFTKEDIGNYTCASDPTIDNYFKHSSAITIHDGFEYDRQQKIHNICEFGKKNKANIKLRVCWSSSGGDNCCNCEKCYRTIMGIIAEKDDPKKYGLELNEQKRDLMIKYLKKNLKYNTKNGNVVNYMPIQKKFIQNYTLEETPNDLLWFRTIKIGSKSMIFYYNAKQIKNKLKKILKKILYK